MRGDRSKREPRKKTDLLANFWAEKLDLIEGHESILEIINQEK
jgi:hypothetical protein